MGTVRTTEVLTFKFDIVYNSLDFGSDIYYDSKLIPKRDFKECEFSGSVDFENIMRYIDVLLQKQGIDTDFVNFSLEMSADIDTGKGQAYIEAEVSKQ